MIVVYELVPRESSRGHEEDVREVNKADTVAKRNLEKGGGGIAGKKKRGTMGERTVETEKTRNETESSKKIQGKDRGHKGKKREERRHDSMILHDPPGVPKNRVQILFF